jgi:hypothetical protein
VSVTVGKDNMLFEKFKIHATPHISDAYCECGDKLEQVSNGWFSVAMYCLKCESVYTLQLRKVPKKKVTKKFLEQCREECAEE